MKELRLLSPPPYKISLPSCLGTPVAGPASPPVVGPLARVPALWLLGIKLNLSSEGFRLRMRN